MLFDFYQREKENLLEIENLASNVCCSLISALVVFYSRNSREWMKFYSRNQNIFRYFSLILLIYSILFVLFFSWNFKTNEVIVFPKIAIRSSDGPIVIREREKILDEKIVRRTEEVPCPVTGQPQLRTVEYIEKIIETEVRWVARDDKHPLNTEIFKSLEGLSQIVNNCLSLHLLLLFDHIILSKVLFS